MSETVEALIAGGATVGAALIGLIVSRSETNDQRSRLLEEVQILDKLPPTDAAYARMQTHVRRSVHALTESSRRHRRLLAIMQVLWILLVLAALTVLWLIEIDKIAILHQVWTLAFYPLAAILLFLLAVEIRALVKAEEPPPQ